MSDPRTSRAKCQGKEAAPHLILLSSYFFHSILSILFFIVFYSSLTIHICVSSFFPLFFFISLLPILSPCLFLSLISIFFIITSFFLSALSFFSFFPSYCFMPSLFMSIFSLLREKRKKSLFPLTSSLAIFLPFTSYSLSLFRFSSYLISRHLSFLLFFLYFSFPFFLLPHLSPSFFLLFFLYFSFPFFPLPHLSPFFFPSLLTLFPISVFPLTSSLAIFLPFSSFSPLIFRFSSCLVCNHLFFLLFFSLFLLRFLFSSPLTSLTIPLCVPFPFLFVPSFCNPHTSSFFPFFLSLFFFIVFRYFYLFCFLIFLSYSFSPHLSFPHHTSFSFFFFSLLCFLSLFSCLFTAHLSFRLFLISSSFSLHSANYFIRILFPPFGKRKLIDSQTPGDVDILV
ncbi:unnamed protein product [Acanthosepion pharaonis]|uniref:Uncharacterized protein n=1 Tax=Acanthosepion pharaonis TaxID=158019 RepID=A0A812ESC4_ACAPH|nr:unnamed protein product [Sepia pharaonis]